MTTSNKLGYVASFPFPDVLTNINAYTLGALSVNPDVTTNVTWINSWFDPALEADAAQGLIDAGADVLLQNTDSTDVLQTAAANGAFAFGWISDLSAFAPQAHLASCIVNWGPYYIKSVSDVMEGTWVTERTVWGVQEGQNDLAQLNPTIPEAVRSEIATILE